MITKIKCLNLKRILKTSTVRNTTGTVRRMSTLIQGLKGLRTILIGDERMDNNSIMTIVRE